MNDKHLINVENYNSRASHYFTRFLNLDPGHLRYKFLSKLPKGAHILDAGCGPGRDTKYFIDQGYQVTAFDAAEELVNLARDYTKHHILKMTFAEMDFKEEFDGIWAMASLLHVRQKDLPKVIETNLIPALKPQGILYLNFKYGQNENFTNGRYFSDYDEESLLSLLSQFDDLSILEIWQCEDTASDRKGRLWINGLVQKR